MMRELLWLFNWLLSMVSASGLGFLIGYVTIAQGTVTKPQLIPNQPSLADNFQRSMNISSAITNLTAQVSKDNIIQHIKALEGPRYNKKEKTNSASYIKTQLENFGYVVQTQNNSASENLIAKLDGTLNPERIFIVGAHYDTVSNTPGADDNASAIAGMLEIARLLAGTSIASTVQFVAFDNEEKGLLGSYQYAKSLNDAGANVIGMISLEMIAYTCKNCQTPFSNIKGCLDVQPEAITAGDFIAIVANTHSKHMIRDFTNAANHFVPSLKFVSAIVAGNGNCFANTRRSDHAPFWDLGYPAIMLTDTSNFRNPNYHKATDTLDTLDLEFASKVVKATLATILTIANFEDSQLQIT